MAQLIVRNIEPEVVRRLKLRAARHGVSAEAEHRQILRDALTEGVDATTFEEFLLQMPDVGNDEDFDRTRDRGREIEI